MRHRRTLSLIGAVASLALTAGIATAHFMPAASTDGLATASAASGKTVPMGVDGSFTDSKASNAADPSAQPTDTHGYTVSQAAQNPTPTDGTWANHGDYVSSIAKGWGQQSSAASNAAEPSPSEPAQATDGLAHRP
jgi:hypothetical protein